MTHALHRSAINLDYFIARLQCAIIRRLSRWEYSLYENTHIAFWRVTPTHNAEAQRFHAVSLEESDRLLR